MKRTEKPQDICVIDWDWKASIEIESLNECLKAGFNYFTEVDSGGDSYAILGTKGEVTQEVAQWAYNSWSSYDEDYNSESGYGGQLIMFLDTEDKFIESNED
jgi:hypothetical protein